MTESENMEEKTNSKNNYVNLSAIYATQQLKHNIYKRVLNLN